MAKKGAQLQLEINNDEEWEKLLLKDGLILVDVYTEWCGPCSGMSANLKKIKLEYGGDLLILAMAKSDYITDLERFRHKSEPTWLFISKGKKVNLLFGANAPEIMRIITDEINKERHAVETGHDRPERTDITEMHPIEIARYEEVQRQLKLAKEREEAKKIKDFRERKIAECKNIINNLSMGTILIFPCAKDRYTEILVDTLKEASVMVAAFEKVDMNVDILEEMFYFYEEEEPPFDEPSLNSLLNDQCIILALKGTHGADISNWEDVLAKVVYGKELKAPPGDRYSPYMKLLTEVEDEETGEVEVLTGIWVPKISCIRATMLRMFFSKFAAALEIPDPGPPPPHYAMVFETKKVKPALQLMSKWPKQFLHYGFFTKEDPEDTEIVAKSVQRLEMPAYRDKRTYEEKLVVAVSQRKSELLLDLLTLGPVYMSPNTEEGAKDSGMFFADDYADSLEDDEKVYIEEEEEEEEEEPEEEPPPPPPVKEEEPVVAEAEGGGGETEGGEEGEPEAEALFDF